MLNINSLYSVYRAEEQHTVSTAVQFLWVQAQAYAFPYVLQICFAICVFREEFVSDRFNNVKVKNSHIRKTGYGCLIVEKAIFIQRNIL